MNNTELEVTEALPTNKKRKVLIIFFSILAVVIVIIVSLAIAYSPRSISRYVDNNNSTFQKIEVEYYGEIFEVKPEDQESFLN